MVKHTSGYISGETLDYGAGTAKYRKIAEPLASKYISFDMVAGKNVDVVALQANDTFGVSVSLDGNRLAAGASGDDGFGNTTTDAGAAGSQGSQKVYGSRFPSVKFRHDIVEHVLRHRAETNRLFYFGE